ncbi:MAG: ATP-binding cassette domain-containing protein [Clostridia bacterium]|nr:ATP-binding cassette domain-containing protein [Clostridia bacterium]
MKILKTERLTYGHIKGPIIVKDWSCELEDGLVLLCGEYGSGKTTLMNLLSGMLDLYYGKILVCEKAPKSSVSNISYLTSIPVALKNQTVEQNFKFACDAAGVSCDRIVHDDWFLNYDKTKFKKLSLLNQFIFCLKRAELKNSKLVLIDQNLDSLSNEELEVYLKYLSEKFVNGGKLTILSTTPKVFKKLQNYVAQYQILYQNRQKIEYFKNIDDFHGGINCYSMADYFDYKKDVATIVSNQNGYMLSCGEVMFKLPDKIIKPIESYFEVSDSAEVFVYFEEEWKNLSNSEFLSKLASSQILIFDSLSGEKLN